MTMERIVVGVDASEGSRRALRWAAEEAASRDAELEVVHVYDYTPAWRAEAYPSGAEPGPLEVWGPEMDAATREAADHAQRLVDEMVAELDRPGVTTHAVLSSRPAQILVERSADAALLVVGSRGRGGFAGLLLGSVSQRCVMYAACPVVVVPPAGEGT
jgi:nucleotide-binding universal stress UspA family protein